MSVNTISLIWKNLILIKCKEIGNGANRRRHHFSGLAFAVILYHPAVTSRIGYVKMIIPSAGRKHIVLLQKLHSFRRTCRPVQNQADCKSSSNHRLACILMHRLAVQCQYRNGYTLFIHAVQTDKRCCQCGKLFLHALFRGIGRYIIQRCEAYRLITILRLTVHQHSRGIPSEIVISSHQNISVCFLQSKRAAPEIRNVNLYWQYRKRLLHDRINQTLVICDSVLNQPVQIILILHIHAIQIILLIIRHLLNGPYGLKPSRILTDKFPHTNNQN